jgi:hypothetical protein
VVQNLGLDRQAGTTRSGRPSHPEPRSSQWSEV